MDIIDFLFNFFEELIYFVTSIEVILILYIIIILFHFLSYIIRDKKNIKDFKSYKDPDEISITDLKSQPIINIIIPAWKEGDIFRNLLDSITALKYPHLNIIVNAGGNEETIEIANSFKNFEYFKILHQKGGADRPSLGKIRALNECLEYIKEGLVYFIDADSYLTDEIILRIIYPIINLDKDMVVGGVRPLKSQEMKDFVKYLQIDRFYTLKWKSIRQVSTGTITGQNFCLKYEILKSIGRFSENRKFSTDKSMGIDLYSKGYSSYVVYDYRSRIFVDYSSSIRDYLRQKTIWIENSLIFLYKNKKIGLLKLVLLFLFSIYLFIFPILLFFHIGLFFIGFLFFLNFYLVKIRKFLFFKAVVNKEYYEKHGIGFFIKIIFYIYVEAAIVIRIPFHFLFFLRKI